MLGNEDLWQTAEYCDSVLRREKLPYSICGGVAVCLHGYQRNTTDIDLVIRAEDRDAVSNSLIGAGFRWDEQTVEFRSESGIAVQCLISGEPAGKEAEVKIPEPIGDANVEIREGLCVVRLSRLIEMKLASAMTAPHRLQDFADVIKLIRANKLSREYGNTINPYVEEKFLEMWQSAQVEEDY